MNFNAERFKSIREGNISGWLNPYLCVLNYKKVICIEKGCFFLFWVKK